MRLHWLSIPVLLSLTLSLYLKSLWFDFLTWDDLGAITQNRILQQGNWLEFWQKPYQGLWIPVSYTLWTWLTYLAPVDHPALPFHAMNIWLHTMNGVLVYEWLEVQQPSETAFRRLRSLAGSLLFLLHPIQVQTVAWVSGGRDLLATFFSLLALHSFLNRRHILFFSFFAAALGSKPTSVILPLFIFCISPERLSRVGSRAIWFGAFALAVLVGLMTTSLQFALTGLTPWFQRPILALECLWYYGATFLNPVALTFDPALKIKEVLENPLLPLRILISVFVILFLSVKKETRAGMLAVLIAFFPVLGFFSFDFQRISLVSNHYAYFACVPMAYLCTKMLGQLSLAVLFAAWLSTLSFKSYEEINYWKDSKTLFARAVRVQNKSYSAHLHLAVQLHIEEDFERATHHYLEALKIERTEAVARNLGLLYLRSGRLQEAEAAFRESVRLGPFFPDNWLHLSKTVHALGRKSEAASYQVYASRLMESVDVEVHHSMKTAPSNAFSPSH